MDQKPRVKVMCVFLHNGRTLASKAFDKTKNEKFGRLLGGSLELRETTEEGIRREIREELGCEIENLTLLKVAENLFTYEGNQGHDIVFVFKGDLANKELYEKEIIRIVEPYAEFDAEWISTSDILEGKIPLYPAMDYSEILK
jgi:ADP-ribose pyrophosphatase YjhB (NUDIX family)